MKPVYIVKMGEHYLRIKSGSATIVSHPWQGSIYNRVIDAEYQLRHDHYLSFNNPIPKDRLRVVEILFDVVWEEDWIGKSIAGDAEIPL